MKPTIIDALRSPALFGALPAFRRLDSWRAWLVFLCAVYGLPFASLRKVGIGENEALDIFCRHTGRTTYDPPAGGYREAAAIVGVQSGKTRIAGTIAGFEALTAQPEADQTEMYCALVAQDQRSSLRTLFSYSAAPFDSIPAFARMVPSGWRAMWHRARRADSLTLETGTRIAVYPCRPAALRGIRARVVICDELAFYRSTEGHPVDVEMLRVARGRVATTSGRVVILSSPYAQSGALYELHRRHHGRDDSATLVWQASASEMNPTLPQDYLARMAQDDPEAFRSEVLGEFRSGVATFLDADALAACVAEGIRERAPAAGIEYTACFDASGGRTDAAALAIAHAERGRAVLDVIRAWPSPHNPAAVIAEACALLRRFRVSEVMGDRYGGEFVVEQFRTHGIDYRASGRDRSAVYLEFLPGVNAGSFLLLDDPDTLRELRALERRRGPSGRDRVDHRPGAHDDRAVAAAGALVEALAAESEPPLFLVGSPSHLEWLERHHGTYDDDEDDELGDGDDVTAEATSPGETLGAARTVAGKLGTALGRARSTLAGVTSLPSRAADRVLPADEVELARRLAARRQRRELRELQRRERQEQQEWRERLNAGTRALEVAVRRNGSWFPGD